MSYIGRGIDQIDNISTLDNLSFNGSDATFNLTQNSVAFVPVSADALQIQIDGVIQSGNYTCSGSQVTFDFVPSGSSVCNGIRHFGVGLLTTVSDSSITTAKLGADSVNGSKIADNSISDEHLDNTAITGQTAITSLADTDKFLVSDASDSGNLKYVEKQYLPSGTLVKIADANITSNVGSHFFSNVFSSTYDSYFLDLRKLRFTSDIQLQLRFLSNTGTGEFSGTYYQFAFYGLDAQNNEERDFGNGDSKLVIGREQDGDSTSDGGITGHMYFYNPLANNGSSVNCVGQFAYRNNSNIFNGISFSGNYSGTAPRYGFVLFGSQNISELRATLYGIVK